MKNLICVKLDFHSKIFVVIKSTSQVANINATIGLLTVYVLTLILF